MSYGRAARGVCCWGACCPIKPKYARRRARRRRTAGAGEGARAPPRRLRGGGGRPRLRLPCLRLPRARQAPARGVAGRRGG